MNFRSTIQTIFSRLLILVLNFGLIIFSANIWGSTGKGTISLLIADLTIVVFFTNVFAGSSVSFFASKFSAKRILYYAYGWSAAVGLIIPLILGLFRQQHYLFYLIALSVLSSLLAANINLFVGLRKIRWYNLYTILQLTLHALFIFVIVYLLDVVNVEMYFVAQIASVALLFLSSSVQLWRRLPHDARSAKEGVALEMFNYGWKTQLSGFLQFLNNRLSFYFLEFFKGVGSVGIFSVGVAFSEAIWAISRSLAVILYADLVNSNDDQRNVLQTKLSLKVSFILTSVFIVIMLSVPEWFYTVLFGKDFSQTKMIILLLSPGILAIAVSNIIGHYFSAMNKLRILNLKSLLGLLFTVPASLYCIPRWGIVGAGVVTSISYCLSSALLIGNFYKFTAFNFSDFMVTKAEVKLLLNKLKKKK